MNGNLRRKGKRKKERRASVLERKVFIEKKWMKKKGKKSEQRRAVFLKKRKRSRGERCSKKKGR